MDTVKDFHVDDGKSDDTTGESALPNSSHKPSPRASPGHPKKDVSNGGNSNDNLPLNDGLGHHDETNDGGLTASMINGMSTASVPISYQRMQNNNPQQQQQPILLYPQQQQSQQP